MEVLTTKEAVEAVVEETVRRISEEIRSRDMRTSGRLGFTEAEAAALLGIKPHILRDARRRGEVHARLVGKRFVYSRQELERFLAEGDDR